METEYNILMALYSIEIRAGRNYEKAKHVSIYTKSTIHIIKSINEIITGMKTYVNLTQLL